MFFRDLETERLLLRGIGTCDRAFILREFSDETVTRYLFDEEPMRELSEADALIDVFNQPEPRAQHRWILILRASGEMLGTCGFHCWNRETGEAELGYDLMPAFFRQGYATEAVRAALAFGREEMRLRHVYIVVYPDNVASARVAQKMGGALDGKRAYRFRGADYMHDVYRIDFPQGGEA